MFWRGRVFFSFPYCFIIFLATGESISENKKEAEHALPLFYLIKLYGSAARQQNHLDGIERKILCLHHKGLG